MKLDVRDQALHPGVIGSGEPGDDAARRRPVIYVGQSWGWLVRSRDCCCEFVVVTGSSDQKVRCSLWVCVTH